MNMSPKSLQKERIPFPVLMLSISTLFINWSSVVIFTCMPLVLTKYFSLGMSSTGSLEGAVEGFSLITRAVSGMVSDVKKKRKGFLVVGYIVSLLSRFISSTSISVYMMASSRFLDKFGNGVQASPREAFIMDQAPQALLGKSFGLNKTFGMLGSSIGSLLLWWVFHMWGTYWSENLFKILWGSTFLMFIATGLLIIGTRETHDKENEKRVKKETYFQRILQIIKDIKTFPRSYWTIIIISFLFKLGYFSGAYIMLFVQRQKFTAILGIPVLSDIEIPAMVMSIQNISCALLSYPMGCLSDFLSRRSSVFLGFTAMLLALLCFSFGSQYSNVVIIGIILYGIQMSMQGALLALLSISIPDSLRGTGFGVFYFLTGISVIIANSLIMKPICDFFTPETAFLFVCLPICFALGFLFSLPSHTTTKEKK